jgi:hypothetical protein
LHAQLSKQRLGRKILPPGFGTNGRKIQLLKSGSDGRARGFEAEPLTPELSIAPAPETDNRTGTVVLVLKPDIADDLPRLRANDRPQAQLAVPIKEVDLGLHPFVRLVDGGRQFRIQMLHRLDIAVDSEQRFGLNIHELAARGAIRDTKVLAALADPPEARMKTGQIEKRYGLDTLGTELLGEGKQAT